jgi:hypothetical protein
MNRQTAENGLDTYKQIRRRFFVAGEQLFGPGVMSMAEYSFTRKVGRNPFAVLLTEPRVLYDEWIIAFKGAQTFEGLLSKIAGPGYQPLLESIKRNDAVDVWSIFERLLKGTDFVSTA